MPISRLGGLADGEPRRPWHEPGLRRRRERARRRRPEGRARRVPRQRAQTLAPKIAVFAGDLCPPLHLSPEVAPRDQSRILASRSRGDNPLTDELAAICACCQIGRKPCKINNSGSRLSVCATPV